MQLIDTSSMGVMISVAHVFVAACWVVAVGWLWQAVTALRGMPRLPDLTCIESDLLPVLVAGDSPHLTVIVPARDEGAAIEATLRSLLASIGIRLQIVAIDDRSSDHTGKIMDTIAAEAAANGGPHEVQAMHVGELPSGWLGKPHAMALGAEQARAPWLLFTDGDVLFHHRALELALRKALASDTDHLVLVPTLILRTFRERAMLASMQALAQWTIRLWKVADPRARDSIGVGGFNLVRREAYARVGGFAGLRMEVLEDLSFGVRVKGAGFSQRVVVGSGLVRIRWIDGALSVIRLVEKNGFAASRFRVPLHLLICFGLAVQVVMPLVAIVLGGWTMVAGLVTYLAIGLVFQANRRVSGVAPWLAIFFGPAVGILLYGTVRSMVLALVRGGVDWRGTRYPLEELRRNAGPLR